MRLSAIKGDPGYDAKAPHRAAVTLDGVLLDLCHTADEEQGFVVCFRRSPSGQLLLHPYKPDELLEDTLRGRVRIWLNGPPAGAYAWPEERVSTGERMFARHQHLAEANPWR